MPLECKFHHLLNKKATARITKQKWRKCILNAILCKSMCSYIKKEFMQEKLNGINILLVIYSKVKFVLFKFQSVRKCIYSKFKINLL